MGDKTNENIVIVGAGESGIRAAENIVNKGWEGKIIVIDKEPNTPYQRPPLSKEVLSNKDQLKSLPTTGYDQLVNENVEFFLGTQVLDIDRKNKIVHLESTKIPYSKLLLATGATPRILPGFEPDETRNILYLRTIKDSLRIKESLGKGKKIIIVGGGFIGLEVAASARQQGSDVLIVEAAQRLLQRAVPKEIAVKINELHKQNGVEILYDTTIKTTIEENEEKYLELSSGRTEAFDALIIGIGAQPNITLAQESNLEIENGIKVNCNLQTSDPNIFACGDCCFFPNDAFGGQYLRLESWRNAQEQGEFVAESILGINDTYNRIPWFWSDQYDKTLQIAGLPHLGETLIYRQVSEGNDIYFHFSKEKKLVGVSGFGSNKIAKQIKIAEKLMEKQAIIEPEELRKPDVNLKALLKQYQLQ